MKARLNDFGRYIKKKLSGKGEGSLLKPFDTTALIYCVGAMAIFGSLEDGLNGIIVFSLRNLLWMVLQRFIFSSSMGIGVSFSAVRYSSIRQHLAICRLLQALLSDAVVVEMSAVVAVWLIFGWD